MTPGGESKALTIVCREVGGQERINKYVKAARNLLNSYATDVVIAKVASEIKSLKKRP